MTTPAQAARRAKRQLKALSRPVGAFDASRYFRGTLKLGFYNVGTPTVRRMAGVIVAEHADAWRVADATAFADALMGDRHLEAKALGIETLARFRREFTPRVLLICKRWLTRNLAANWATTDLMCGMLIGPLLLAEPQFVDQMPVWSGHPNMWVRRASAVALIPSLRRGLALDAAYTIAARLDGDPEDLIQKAVGWMLREAGKADPRRLQRYLIAQGSRTPRTTVRYAIERFTPATRRALLAATRAGDPSQPPLQ